MNDVRSFQQDLFLNSSDASIVPFDFIFHLSSKTVANNGNEALEIIEHQSFDLIFMDLQMPGIDGIETTLQINKNPSFQNIPIVALTAAVMVEDRMRCLDAGMCCFLPKPISFKAVIETLNGIEFSSGARMDKIS